MTGDFIQGSVVTGVVIADVSSSGIHFYLLARGNDQLELDSTISSLVNGQHTISAFVIEESGLPFSRAATVPHNVLVIEGNKNSVAEVSIAMYKITCH